MALWLYSAVYYLITPLIALRLMLRSVKAPAYRRRIAERFGFYAVPNLEPGCIWLHSVSVGETIAAAPLVKQLQQRYPDKKLLITTMTPTGSERVKALFADTVNHVYVPYDLPCCLNRFLNWARPTLLVIMETELWPNTIAQCRRRDIPVLLINARLSEKSAVGYQRFSALTKPMLQGLTWVAAQTESDANRFIGLGLPAERVHITGSIKFDIAISQLIKQQAQPLKQLCSAQGRRFVWIAASTHKGEDELMLTAHRLLLGDCPDALLILVPRHPERFNAVVQLAQSQGFSTARRSLAEQPEDAVQVYVGDTMGEMLVLFGAADAAFVGGSLVPSGGHNMLEPAAWGLPILTGPSDFNFLEISQMLMQAGALNKITDSQSLNDQLKCLIDPATRLARGDAALQIVEANRGALDKLLALMASEIV